MNDCVVVYASSENLMYEYQKIFPFFLRIHKDEEYFITKINECNKCWTHATSEKNQCTRKKKSGCCILCGMYIINNTLKRSHSQIRTEKNMQKYLNLISDVGIVTVSHSKFVIFFARILI